MSFTLCVHQSVTLLIGSVRVAAESGYLLMRMIQMWMVTLLLQRPVCLPVIVLQHITQEEVLRPVKQLLDSTDKTY